MKSYHYLLISIFAIITLHFGSLVLIHLIRKPEMHRRGKAPFSPSQPAGSARLNYGSIAINDLLLLPKLGFHTISLIAEAAQNILNTNAGSYTFNNRLYVHSNIPAETEDPYVFKWHTVIDLYEYENGKKSYQYSYYLPEFKGHKVKAFKVTADHIIALQGNYEVRYSIFKDTLYRVN